MKSIYFDLDGTILDVSERSYRIYQDVLKDRGRKPLDKRAYWKLKRQGKYLDEILTVSGCSELEEYYLEYFHYLVESQFYLKYDRISPRIRKCLKSFRGPLVLITARRNSSNLKWELKKLKIKTIFRDIVFTQPGWEDRAKVLEEQRILKPEVLIGDTEQDVKAGKEIGIKTIAISSGVKNKSILQDANPDVMIRDLTKVRSALKKWNISI